MKLERAACFAAMMELWSDMLDLESNAENDLEFMEVARELNKWFGTLLAERNRKSAEKVINW